MDGGIVASDLDVLGGLNSGKAYKAPCAVATTGDITNTMIGLPVIDGYQVQAGDRVLVWQNTDARTNGIYSAQLSAWTRTIDFSNSSAVTEGTQVLVTGGLTYLGTIFNLQESTVVFGSTNITFGIYGQQPGVIGVVSATFQTLALLQAARLSGTTKVVTILGYAAPGDAPPRVMIPIATPSPVQPWHVQSLDGQYWQDSGGDFWVEWLGAITSSANCAPALNNSFLAHLNLGMVLRGRGTKTCTSQVFFDTSGFQTRFCWAEFNGEDNAGGKGMTIAFADNVPAPCWSMFAGTPSGGTFYGKLHGLAITGNTNGLMGQIGRTDFGDALNDFDAHILVANRSTGSSAAVLQVNGLYTSRSYFQANGPGNVNPPTQVGQYAMQFNQCNENTLKIAAGGMGIGLQLANFCTGNTFSGEVALCYIAIQQFDYSCSYNKYDGGALSDNTYVIDNHLTFVNSPPSGGVANGSVFTIQDVAIGGNTNIFFNPGATDKTWGGAGVKIDIPSWNQSGWVPPTGAPVNAAWVLNQGAIGYDLCIFGASTTNNVELLVREWFDFSSAGFGLATQFPCIGYVGAGEQAQINFNGGSYTVGWRPRVT